MKNRRLGLPLVAALVGLALLLAACGAAATESISPLSAPSQSTVAVPDEALEIVDLAQQDLAEQLGVNPEEIDVAQVEAVEWPDASLGCPKPDMIYASVLSPGYRIVLEAQEQEYVYHTGPDGFVRCDMAFTEEEPIQKVRKDSEPTTPAEQAQQDLSKQLGIAPNGVEVLAVEAVEWPDSSLGCPQPGMNYLTAVTPGYRIILGAEGKTYEYHSDGERVVHCPEPQPPIQERAKTMATTEEALVSAAQADLSQRLGVDATQVEMVRVEAVQWPDTSLGCPQPGMLYAQVITPGYRIVLSADGQEYVYHADLSTATLCQK